MGPEETSLSIYKFEILTNAIEEIGLAEATVFKCTFGAINDNAAAQFASQISELWNRQNPLNSSKEFTYQMKFEKFLPDSN